jgi:multidrug efflux pump subunit AcrB
VLLAGPDLKVLETRQRRILQRMREMPGATDVDSTLVVGKPELVIIDRARCSGPGRAGGIDVARRCSCWSPGQKVSTYAEAASSTTCACAPPRTTAPSKKLRLLTVPSRKVGLVSLADVVHHPRAVERRHHSALPARAPGDVHVPTASRAPTKAPSVRTVMKRHRRGGEKLPKGFSRQGPGPDQDDEGDR